MKNPVSFGSVTSNFLWRFFERCGAQGVSFVVSLVLARIIAPEAYGIVAIVAVFSNILGVFVNSGFCGALIQKKEVDDIDYSSVFYFNIVSSFLMYGIVFFASPVIAQFYNMPELTSLIRVMGLSLFAFSVKLVQQAYVSRNLLFKRFFWATLGGTIGAGILGIGMAYAGYGVWALVIQELFNTVVDTVVLWVTVKWRPIRQFSFARLKILFSYGWKMLASSLLDTTYNNLRALIIGKRFSSSDLAFYNKGDVFPNMIVSNINSSIDSVLLPVLAGEQDNKVRVREMTSRAIKTATYIMMPMMMGLAVCAEPIVQILLTEKWLPCVPYLRIFCFSYAFYPIATANLNAIKALGRSDYFLKLEIVKKIVGLTAIGITMWFGVIWMVRSLIITSILSQIINSYPNKKLLGYSYLNQVKDMLPQIVLSCVMGGCVLAVRYIGVSDILTLLIQIPLGALIYVGGSMLFHIESFEYLFNMVKPVLGKLRKKTTE